MDQSQYQSTGSGSAAASLVNDRYLNAYGIHQQGASQPNSMLPVLWMAFALACGMGLMYMLIGHPSPIQRRKKRRARSGSAEQRHPYELLQNPQVVYAPFYQASQLGLLPGHSDAQNYAQNRAQNYAQNFARNYTPVVAQTSDSESYVVTGLAEN